MHKLGTATASIGQAIAFAMAHEHEHEHMDAETGLEQSMAEMAVRESQHLQEQHATTPATQRSYPGPDPAAIPARAPSSWLCLRRPLSCHSRVCVFCVLCHIVALMAFAQPSTRSRAFICALPKVEAGGVAQHSYYTCTPVNMKIRVHEYSLPGSVRKPLSIATGPTRMHTLALEVAHA